MFRVGPATQSFADGLNEFGAFLHAHDGLLVPSEPFDTLAPDGATVDLSVAHTVHNEQRLPKHVGATTPITRAFTGARYAFGRAKLVDKTLPKPIQILHRAPPFRRVWREAS